MRCSPARNEDSAHGEASRRVLYYVSIVHSQGDMGSLGKRLPAQRAQAVATGEWPELAARVRGLALTWGQVRVYQDGLPDTDGSIILKILNEVTSPNYDLLRWLVAQGAQLIGTESPALLREEYEHLRAVLTADATAARQAAQQAYLARAPSMLVERDSYIARKIDQTLGKIGIGLLFIGRAHRVAEHLPNDIVVLSLPRNNALTT